MTIDSSAVYLVLGLALGALIFYLVALLPAEREKTRRKLQMVEMMGFVWMEGWAMKPSAPAVMPRSDIPIEEKIEHE